MKIIREQRNKFRATHGIIIGQRDSDKSRSMLYVITREFFDSLVGYNAASMSTKAQRHKEVRLVTNLQSWLGN